MSPKRGARVALYIRVSTQKQADGGHSLDGQRAELEEHARARGYRVVAVVVDRGESAGTLDRPGIRELQGLAAAREVDAVLVTKSDRLARSLRDQLNLVADFGKDRVAVVAADGAFENASTPIGRAMTSMQGVFAELEREMAGQRTREGMAAARAKGIRLGRPPVGYTVDPDNKGVLVSVADHPAVARRMAIEEKVARLRAEGEGKPMSWRKVAERLNAEGVPTVTGKVGTWDHKRAAKFADILPMS